MGRSAFRIVAGRLGGRRFHVEVNSETRPTSERVRESLSSALDARGLLTDARVLELYAGTGSLSFELLSRGAKRAVLVENNRRIAAELSHARAELELQSQMIIVCGDAEKLSVHQSVRSHGPFDLVVADPPYDRACEAATHLSWVVPELAPDATIVFERRSSDLASAETLTQHFGAHVAEFRFGDTTVQLFRPTREPSV